MAEKYTYSITGDTLNGAVDSTKLFKQIEESSIVTTLEYINTDEGTDALDIWFESVLSGEDEVTLTAVVAAHDGLPMVPFSTLFKKVDTKESSTTSSFSYVEKMSMPYSNLDAGTYKISFSAELKSSSSYKKYYISVLDGTKNLITCADTSVSEQLITNFSTGTTVIITDSYKVVSGFILVDYEELGSGTIYIKYKTESKATVYIKNVNLVMKKLVQ